MMYLQYLSLQTTNIEIFFQKKQITKNYSANKYFTPLATIELTTSHTICSILQSLCIYIASYFLITYGEIVNYFILNFQLSIN
jgi:phage gp36-like protein